MASSWTPCWLKAADGTAVALGEDLTFVMPACDVTVTARWQAPAYGTPDFTLPGQITHVESMAFSGAAMRVVWIPDGCIQIGALAFSDCPNLTQVRIPDRCAIGTGAFEGSAGIVYIYGTAGSDAERYCLENSGCVFVEE